MKFSRVVDAYIDDMWSQGRIRSPRTERSYRSILDRHGEDIEGMDVRKVTRVQVKKTLRRWANPNTQSTGRAILVSFYRWLMEEGVRRDNPAEQTPRPRRQRAAIYRLTIEETRAMLQAAHDGRERRAIHLGICAGLRNAELRGLQGRHFQRDGFVWVSADIAKGGRERWVPVIGDLEPVVQEIRAHVGTDEYVLPAQRWRRPAHNDQRMDLKRQPSSSQALRTLVMAVAARAGIGAHIHPHLLRHAFGDHIARLAGVKTAQALLGHADIKTTESYTGAVTLDELAAAVAGFRFAPIASDGSSGTVEGPQSAESTSVPTSDRAGNTDKAPTGIEPVQTSPRSTIGFLSGDAALLLARWPSLKRNVETYAEAFGA